MADATDCDDADTGVHPGALEHCDGIDEDCDGAIDEGAADWRTWYADADCDGFGDAARGTTTCTPPSGYVADDTDCDDAQATVNPDADEHCDGVDEDCDGLVDDAPVDPRTWYTDADGDGFGLTASATSACTQPSGSAADPGDCDDGSAAVYPGASEHCDGVDEDCDGSTDEGAVDAGTWYPDVDSDGYGDPSGAVVACTQPSGTVSAGGDCDDASAAVHPGATEHCDGVDEDCDGSIDDGAVGLGTWYSDADGDGFGDLGGAVTACTQPSGTVSTGTDCDDGDAAVYPGATEHCDGVDEDCDGSVDEGAVDASTWYPDADADGFGTASGGVVACSPPSATSPSSTDCDDGDASIHPGALEHCDGVDEDCDGLVDESAFGAPTWYPDADGDGYGASTGSVRACSAPSGYVTTSTDCADTDATVHPGATEICNGTDDDCDGTTDRAGLVTFVASGGGVTDMSSTFASGTSAAAAAVSLTSSGTLTLCPGTYYVEIQASGADIALVGQQGSGSTTLRSDASGSVVAAASTCADLDIEGLTLYAGGSATYGACLNGGTHGLRTVLDDVVLDHGAASYGGGLFQSSGTVDATDLVVQSCTATANGGGIYLSSVTLTLTSSDIDSNTAASTGGGLYAASGTATLDGVLFSSNTASASSSPYGGGGAYFSSGTTAITDSTFSSNQAYRGGGLMVYGGSATITSSEIDTNAAWSRGAGLYAYSSDVSLSYSMVHDNTASYYGAGLFLYNATVACYGSTSTTAGVYHNTAYWGGGAYVSDYGTLTSSVCDWGSSTSDNSPNDVVGNYSTSTWSYGADASFTCTYLGCY
ncbi:MAG: putative metal-binding motif-containing protein [Pseudomonadota bacterium]